MIAVDSGRLRVEHNPDAEDYLSFAHNLATGVGFAHAINEDKPYSQPVEYSAWRAPLYPMFLSVFLHISHSPLFLQSVQIALAAISLYFFLRLGLILFGETASLIAGLVFALYPPIIFDGGLAVYPRAVPVAPDSGAVLASIRLRRNLVQFVFSFWVCLNWMGRFVQTQRLTLAPALVLAAWLRSSNWNRAATVHGAHGGGRNHGLSRTYRNYRLFHKLVLISTNGGANLWFGAYFRLDPNATMAEVGYSEHQAFRDVPEPEREKILLSPGAADTRP